MEDQNFSLENQRDIYNYILRNPGTHLRKIAQDLNTPLSTIRYHVSYMMKNNILISKKESNMKIYFINGKISTEDRNITPLLQQQRFRDIILLLIITPRLSHSEICYRLDIKPSTLTKYIKILKKRKIVTYKKSGREKRYFIIKEQRVKELLLTYKESFWDKFVDNVLEIFFER